MGQVIEGLELYPWETRIEKAQFIGKATGINHHFFPELPKTLEINYEPTSILIIENPEIYDVKKILNW